MPVVKIEKEVTLIEFGDGDININSGKIKDLGYGIVSFKEVSEDSFNRVKEKQGFDISEHPVHLVFKDTDSLDLLIDSLKHVRNLISQNSTA